MSGKAMSWSRTIKVGRASAKQVLRELCISQNELTGQCCLSIKGLIELTELSEPTVLSALAFLKERGFIKVEKVKTKTGWGNSYSFPMIDAIPKDEGTPKSWDTPKDEGTPKCLDKGIPNSLDMGTPKSWDLKKEEKKEKSMYAPSVEVAHTSVSSKPFSRDQKENTGAPKTEKTQRNSLIQKENRGAPLSESKPAESTEKTTSKPLMQKKNKGADASKRKSSFCTVDRPQDVPEQLWTDFLTHRKAKKAPVTETVISRTRSQARLCGMTLAEALEMTVARGWQGFEARYVLDNRQSPVKPAQQLELSPQAIARRRQAAANKVSPEDAAIADMWEDIFG